MSIKIKKGFKMEVVENNIIKVCGPSGCGKSSYCMDIASMFSMPVINTLGGSSSAGIVQEIRKLGTCAVLIDECPSTKFEKMQGMMREWAGRGCVFVVVINP